MTEWFPLVATGAGILFGSVFVLVGLGLVAVGWSTLRLRLGQRHWVRVPAEVVAVRIEPRTLDETVHYQPKVSYRYFAQGGYLTSERMSLAEKTYPTEARARKLLEKFPVGGTVMASYPSESPEEAVLVPGGGIAGAVVLLLGLAMVAGPLLGATAAGWPGREIGLGIALLVLVLWGWSALWKRRRRSARRNGLLPPPGCGSDVDVLRLIGMGEQLLAIHLYREIHGTGLKEARRAVDALTAKLKGAAS